MSANITNQVAFLQTTREFPEDLRQLTVQVNKAYLETAQCVNSRIIGLYSIGKSAITGERWFLAGNKQQQTLRQVYQFSSAGNIAHGINFSSISAFTKIYGAFTDGSIWYPLPYVNTTAANQVSVVVNSTNIVITAGGGAPAISSGTVVLEWLVNA